MTSVQSTPHPCDLFLCGVEHYRFQVRPIYLINVFPIIMVHLDALQVSSEPLYAGRIMIKFLVHDHLVQK